ncbi:hypothetical protein A0H81_01700 [Grifola frondosa]|uniref:Uncharacterized protein n=1 Tax=Grifola frondosa TaxID=5627 RepID=A0A1C7MM32_GRIFR|nr:hypothetical protein A0H81_01700 [Grifola frondosa]
MSTFETQEARNGGDYEGSHQSHKPFASDLCTSELEENKGDPWSISIVTASLGSRGSRLALIALRPIHFHTLKLLKERT